jgi:hypothetical protein
MFNIAPGHEANYVRYTSPADTQWATSVMAANTGKTIAAANWAQLSFTDWAPSYGGPGFTLGGNITTHNAVVHLLADDIYLDLTFTNFNSGGDFTYDRSTPSATGPTGDYNHNGVVDAGDYSLWRKTPGSYGGDPGGYNTWQANFGNPPGSGSLALGTVPEPATIALQMGSLFALTWRVRKRLAA